MNQDLLNLNFTFMKLAESWEMKETWFSKIWLWRLGKGLDVDQKHDSSLQYVSHIWTKSWSRTIYRTIYHEAPYGNRKFTLIYEDNMVLAEKPEYRMGYKPPRTLKGLITPIANSLIVSFEREGGKKQFIGAALQDKSSRYVHRQQANLQIV